MKAYILDDNIDPFENDLYVGFKNFLCAFNMTISVTLFVLVPLLIWKIGLANIDWAARLTISIYLLGSFFDLITWTAYIFTGEVPEDFRSKSYLLQLAAEMVTWLVLYFFIYEMRIARQKLLSTSLMQMQKLVGKLKKERIIVLLLSLLLMIVILAANAKWCLGELYRDIEN